MLRLNYPQGVTAIAFADDIAVIVEAEDESELKYKTNEALNRLEDWMWRHHLEVAPQKSEAIILKGPRKREGVKFEIGGRNITKAVKYLGVTLDEGLYFGPHVKKTAEKAEKSVTMLARLMPNIGGPSAR